MKYHKNGLPDMDDMKISFKVEITGCLVNNVRCPHLERNRSLTYCGKTEDINAMAQNIYKLTKTCPMVRAQFEALE